MIYDVTTHQHTMGKIWISQIREEFKFSRSNEITFLHSRDFPFIPFQNFPSGMREIFWFWFSMFAFTLHSPNCTIERFALESRPLETRPIAQRCFDDSIYKVQRENLCWYEISILKSFQWTAAPTRNRINLHHVYKDVIARRRFNGKLGMSPWCFAYMSLSWNSDLEENRARLGFLS